MQLISIASLPETTSVNGSEVLIGDQNDVTRRIPLSQIIAAVSVSASDVPIASTDIAGRVKTDGFTLNITSDGTLSVNTYNLVTKTTTINNKALTGDIYLSATDVGLGNVINIDTTNAANITSGTLSASILPVASTTSLGAVKVDGSTITINNGVISSIVSSGGAIDTSSFVNKTLTINSQPLSGNIALSASDVGLGNVVNLDTSNPANITQNASYRFVSDTEKNTWNSKQSALGFVPVANTTTINNKALSGNISLNASDVGLSNVKNIDTTNAANITSGTLSASILPIASTDSLGGVKIDGTSIVINNGVISYNALTPLQKSTLGERVWVRGFSVNGMPDASTQQKINDLLAEGWPEWSILWEYLGESSITSNNMTILPNLDLAEFVGINSASPISQSINIDSAILLLLGSVGGDGIISNLNIQPSELLGKVDSYDVTNTVVEDIGNLIGNTTTQNMINNYNISLADLLSTSNIYSDNLSANILINTAETVGMIISAVSNISANILINNSETVGMIPSSISNISPIISIANLTASNPSVDASDTSVNIQIGEASFAGSQTVDDFAATSSFCGWTQGYNFTPMEGEPVLFSADAAGLTFLTSLDDYGNDRGGYITKSVVVSSSGIISYKIWSVATGITGIEVDGVMKSRTPEVSLDNIYTVTTTPGVHTLKFKRGISPENPILRWVKY